MIKKFSSKVTSIHEVKTPCKCEVCDVQFGLEHELDEHVASVYEVKIILNDVFKKLSLIKFLI